MSTFLSPEKDIRALMKQLLEADRVCRSAVLAKEQRYDVMWGVSTQSGRGWCVAGAGAAGAVAVAVVVCYRPGVLVCVVAHHACVCPMGEH